MRVTKPQDPQRMREGAYPPDREQFGGQWKLIGALLEAVKVLAEHAPTAVRRDVLAALDTEAAREGVAMESSIRAVKARIPKTGVPARLPHRRHAAGLGFPEASGVAASRLAAQ